MDVGWESADQDPDPGSGQHRRKDSAPNIFVGQGARSVRETGPFKRGETIGRKNARLACG